MPTNVELAQRLATLEASIESRVIEGVKEGVRHASLIGKVDVLNQQIKAYDKNIKLVGMTYDIKVHFISSYLMMSIAVNILFCPHA